MEILFITHKFPPIIGGMEKQSFELTTRMEKRHKIHLHAYKGDGSKLKWFFNLKREVKTILKNNPSIEIIHVNDGLMAAACLWLKKYTSIPVVATYHGLDITFPATIFQRYIVPRMHGFHGAICVSGATSEACLDRGFDREKVYTVLNGVDHDLAEIPIDPEFKSRVSKDLNIDFTRKKIIITMGRAVKRKGFSWFLTHVVPLLDEDILFFMVGPLNTNPGISERMIGLFPTSLRDKLQLMLGIATDVKAITKALESPDTKHRVFHMGKVSFPDLMQYLALADVFVMPNIEVEGDAEGFGLVALEASLRGAPVVAAGIEGITDAVRNGKNGIQLPSGQADQWIKTLNDLLQDKARLKEMSERAISSTLADYGWEKMVIEYEEVFQQILDHQKKYTVPRIENITK